MKKQRSLSLYKRFYLFVIGMSITGAGVGAILAEVEIRQCARHFTDNCLTLNPAKKRAESIVSCIFVGAGAAIGASIPALLQKDE